ncbi:hypothetical protein KIN20_022061 [Parelaphostrongylus tenuis]|uniref:Uncharacterized protein n=1 Tax=Parelaphostrongylus tenuis TaxID=148309 RepID=A0AAD5N8K8_PARTN|nr:hypothetical protein KIN20_022061 [Parelaphostrongylus tenuis]
MRLVTNIQSGDDLYTYLIGVQGVLDSRRTLSRIRLVIEPLSSDKDNNNEKVGFYLPVGLARSMEIHHPVV